MRVAASAALLAVSIAAALVGSVLDRAARLETGPRTEPDPASSLPSPAGPLPLRLVDLGGVGIPTDTANWGHDYSHNSKAFHRLILPAAPFVDEAEFSRVRADWTTYVRRMAAYGNNGIVVPLFLELVTFERLPAVYAGTTLGQRHAALREHFRQLFAIAQAAGMDVYLATDMAALTPPLDRYLRRGGLLNPTDPALWATYRAAFDEVFRELPEVRGVVVRIGEAGPLYSRGGWDYRSEFLVGSVAGLRAMLHELLPVFEAHGRTLVLRSWSVGVGELGDLHTNPATYDRALGEITSPSLVISTKFQAGDFFRYLPLNPTLLAGRQKRIVELQARREFEGFEALPNFDGPLYARALGAIRSTNPNVIGTWLWTQNGGPLRASPMSLYPLHGFWLWIDANAYAASRLAVEPRRTAEDLGAEWVRRELTTDSAAVAALTELLLLSPAAIDRGLYIRPFATRRVTFGGYELPPLLWVMEWNIVGGWTAVWSSIYLVTGREIPAAVADGFAALATVDSMRSALERARPALAARPVLFRQMERSLAYEASLLEALAWYRAAFLDYYRWLDTGDTTAYAAWRAAVPRFRQRVAAHQAAFAGDLDFPAFDFSGAVRSAELAQRGADARWPARLLLALLALGLVTGATVSSQGAERPAGMLRALWVGALMPWRLPDEPPPWTACLAAAAVVLAGLAVAVGGAFSLSSPWTLGAIPAALITFVTVLGIALMGLRWDRERAATIAAAGSPLLWIAMVLLGVMSVRGPYHLWYLLWTGGRPRAVLLAIALGAPLWTLIMIASVARRATGRTRRVVLGGVLMALGASLAVLAALAPGIERFLAALDRPLGLAPMTHAVIVGVETYTRLPVIALWYPATIGGMIVAGWALASAGKPATQNA